MSRNFAPRARLAAATLGQLAWLTLAPAALTAVAATPAHAGQVSYRDQDLAELLGHLQQSATAVVTLTLANPVTERQDWRVPGKGDKRCAPYQGWRFRGRLEAVHFASRDAPALEVGGQLWVSPADMPDLISLAQLACTEGISKSPIWERFAGIEPKPGQKVLAVLAWRAEHGWLERVSGAWLDPADLPKVQALLPPAKRFLPGDALRAEFSRQPPEQRASETLPADRPRLLLTLARIGAPGAPPLLPPELAAPKEELWLAKAAQAREPLQRLTALMFLNRLNSPRGWQALAGLTAQDAAQWPAEADVTWALQRASELSAPPAELQPFLQRWQQRPLEEPRRAALNWRRFVTQQAPSPPPLVHTRAALMAISEQWGRATAEQRAAMTRICADPKRGPAELRACEMRWGDGLRDVAHGAALQLLRHSAAEGLPAELVAEVLAARQAQQELDALRQPQWPALLRLTELAAIEQLPFLPKELLQAQRPDHLRMALGRDPAPWRLARALPVVRLIDAAAADHLRAQLLQDPSPLVRAAALADLPAAPTEIHLAVAQIARDSEVDAAQALVEAIERWKLPKAQAGALLTPLLQGAAWAVRLQAWQALRKLEPTAPWPAAPPPTAQEQKILALAEQLQARAEPVRLELEFASPTPGQPAGKLLRRVVLRLDAQQAPLNVANLLILARQGFYNGRAIGRVVPEFVVQMGSPLDTMDGGPGYHVPCENHLQPYTAGSVGMALSGKDTGGSQFFVTLAAAPHLTGRYTRVGQVEDLGRSLAVLRDLGPGDVLTQVRER